MKKIIIIILFITIFFSYKTNAHVLKSKNFRVSPDLIFTYPKESSDHQSNNPPQSTVESKQKSISVITSNLSDKSDKSVIISNNNYTLFDQEPKHVVTKKPYFISQSNDFSKNYDIINKSNDNDIKNQEVNIKDYSIKSNKVESVKIDDSHINKKINLANKNYPQINKNKSFITLIEAKKNLYDLSILFKSICVQVKGFYFLRPTLYEALHNIIIYII